MDYVRHVYPGDGGGAAGFVGTEHGEDPGPATEVQHALPPHRSRRMLDTDYIQILIPI